MGEDLAQIDSLDRWLECCEYGYSQWRMLALLIISGASDSGRQRTTHLATNKFLKWGDIAYLYHFRRNDRSGGREIIVFLKKSREVITFFDT